MPKMGLSVYLTKKKVIDMVEFEANITHNLVEMADEAGVYMSVWRPEESGILKAGQLIPVLRKGIEMMEADPDRFRKFDSPNGWGTYDDFLPWLKKYLGACEEHPEASVESCR